MAERACRVRWNETGSRLAVLVVASVALGLAPAARAAAPTVVTAGPNLIVNGDAEFGAPSGSGYDTVTIPGWRISGLPTVVRYGQETDGYTGTAGGLRGESNAGTFPTDSTPGPADRGKQLFVGGAVGSDTLTQTVSLASVAGPIDAGGVRYTLGGWLGGNGSDTSAASVTVTFMSATGSRLGAATIGPVSVADRLLTTELRDRTTTGSVPKGSRSALATLTLTDGTAPNAAFVSSYNNAYADDLTLHISVPIATPPVPTPPTSRVGRLGHVFMVYMENEGDGDIVGNPTAPYLNSLIDRYGFATDYHAIEHPSDPNYIAFFGGSTFGIDDNCALACTAHERNLADQIEAAHKTWRFYEQTMPSPCYHGDYGPDPNPLDGSYYAPDELPWAYFSDLADNAARCQAHVFPLGQMATDLASTTTTPNYVWFEADDCDDMEQCGIAAGDTWLSQTVPEIMSSPAFERQRSVIFITWDEDYNNKSFNQDNQDQRVPLIVIPSPDSGMLAGAIRVNTYYTHYSLLRTVELALGLPTLTLNDRFATPLNDFWPVVPVLSGLNTTTARHAITIHYRDSVAGVTTFAVFRGRRTVGSFTHRSHAGANAVRLPRRLGRHALAPGRYRLIATPANAAGVQGTAVTKRFTVTHRRAKHS